MLDRHLRPQAGRWMEPTVQRLLKRGTRPDTLTVWSLLLALASALLFLLAPALPLAGPSIPPAGPASPPGGAASFPVAGPAGELGSAPAGAEWSRLPLLILAAFLVLLSGALDALDGALARKVGPTKRGDFLDHSFDRFGDVLLLGGIVFGGHAPFPWGFAALATMLLTSYLGTQAQALGLGRTYGGLLGRLDRMLAIAVVAGLQFVVPWPVLGFTLLGWLVAGFAVLGGVTVAQRFGEVWGRLKESAPPAPKD
ncbi:MAG: CDP-alcohol phosphatidyltransferase family protein [Halobacteria archaeon]